MKAGIVQAADLADYRNGQVYIRRSMHTPLNVEAVRDLMSAAMFRGTVDGASVHPREVVKQALAHNAAAVIPAHNHQPSQADEPITLRLRDPLGIVDIRVLDHLILTGARVVSLAERGVL